MGVILLRTPFFGGGKIQADSRKNSNNLLYLRKDKLFPMSINRMILKLLTKLSCQNYQQFRNWPAMKKKKIN
jgi:hypothetical protein